MKDEVRVNGGSLGAAGGGENFGRKPCKTVHFNQNLDDISSYLAVSRCISLYLPCPPYPAICVSLHRYFEKSR